MAASLWCDGRITPYGGTMSERVALSMAHSVRVIELFFPAWLYKKKPMFLMPEQGHGDLLRSYSRFMYLFGFLANKASEPWNVPSEDDGPRRMTVVDSPNLIIPTQELVVTSTGVFLGFRLRLTEQQAYPNGGMVANLARLLTENDDLAKKTMNGQKGGRAIDPKTGQPRAVNPFAHSNITTNVWKEMAMHVTGPDYINRALANNPTNNIALDTSAFNLSNVCSLEHSHRVARNMGAAPHFYDRSTYDGETSDHDGQSRLYGFPDPSRVILLHAKHLHPSTLEKRWWPMRQADPRRNTRAREEFESTHGPGSGKYFDAFCVTTSDSSEASDIWTLERQVTQDRKDIAAATSDQHPDVGFRTLREKQLEWQQAMGEIIHTHGDVAPALQFIAAYRDAWLLENGDTLRVERDQTMGNLSRFGDYWAQQLVMLETVATLKTAHKQVIMRIIAYLTVYMRSNDRIHIANFGPAKSGKSFAMLFVSSIFIDGTSMKLVDITQRALCTPGKANDALCIVIEDALPSLLGAQVGNKTGQGGGMGEKENMIKSFLTSLQTALLSVNMDPKREREHIVADTCSIMDVAMNVPTSVFDPAILSRFNVVIWPDQDRPGEGPDMITRNMRSTDQEVKASMQTMKTYWSRTQILVAEIEYRIAAGVMPAVTMDAATMVFGLVAAQMKRKFGVDMQDQRHFNRFKSAVMVLCILAAIDLVWDSALSPLKDMPHSEAHFLLVEKHLVATVEQAVFALGLFSNQWQDDLTADVLSAMKRRFFPKSDQAIAANRAGVVVERQEGGGDQPMMPEQPQSVQFIPTLIAGRKLTAAQEKVENMPEMRQYRSEVAAYDAFQQSKQDWMYATLALPSLSCPAPGMGSRGTICTQQELGAHLAQQIHRHLKDKPLMAEVEAVIQRLLHDTSDVVRTVCMCVGDQGQEERASNVPTLVLFPTVIKMSLTVLGRADQTSILHTAITDVVTALFNNGAIAPHDKSDTLMMIYGETERDAPYVWKRVVARRQHHVERTDDMRELMRVRSANFFDPVLVESTASFLRAVEPIGTDEHRMLRLFKAQTPWFTIDTDLDGWAVEVRSRELGLNPEMQDRGVSNRRVLTEEQLWNTMHEERTARLPANQVHRTYPSCFSGMDSVACFAEHRRMEGIDAMRYSLKNKQAVSLEQRKTFASFEDASVILERLQQVLIYPAATPPPVAAAAAAAATPAVKQERPQLRPQEDHDMLDQEDHDMLEREIARELRYEAENREAFNQEY